MDKKIQDSRICHMHGVAEYMYNNAEKKGLNPDEMYLLGLLHDIGYLKGKVNHEENGAKMLGMSGYKKAHFIKWHGITPREYKNINRCFDSQIPQELILLWEADMHIDQTGSNVGYEIRLDDIGYRLGYDSKAYKSCKETIEWLKSNNWK